MKVCILLPAYNESKTIGPLVRSLRAKQLDVFVVNDGSIDNSGQIAREAGANVIDNPQKSGKGFSLRKGFAHIISLDYDGVIVMDSDGQHAVSDVDNFIQLAEQNPQVMINGNRMAQAKEMPFVRSMTNRLMSLLISLACRQAIPDTQCGYRYIGISVLKDLSLTCNSYEIETEMLMKASKKKFSVLSVPVETIYRNEKSKINPVIDTYRFIIYFLKELFSK